MKSQMAAVAFCVALTACGNNETGGSDASAPMAAPVLASVATSSDVPDGLLVCTMSDFDGISNVTETQPFIFMDGRVLRYAESDNVAFPLCAEGQDGCRLGFEDEALVMDWTAASGVRSSYRVDLDTMTIEAWRTEAGGEPRSIPMAESSGCEMQDLPEGLALAG